MVDFLNSIKEHENTPDDAHGDIGKARAGDMSDDHTDFAKTIAEMIKNGTIDPKNTETFLNKDAYDGLEAELKVTVDKTLPNMATTLSHIADFYTSSETPDASPELKNWIETLWQMKERIETHADVFVF